MKVVHTCFKYSTVQNNPRPSKIYTNSVQTNTAAFSRDLQTDSLTTKSQHSACNCNNSPAFKGLFSSFFQTKTSNEQIKDLNKIFSEDEIKKLKTSCSVPPKYELNTKLLEKAVELKKLKVPFAEITTIINNCTPGDDNLMESLTIDIPKKLKKGDDIGTFIYTRLIATRHIKNNNYKKYYLDEKGFDFFNELYRKHNNNDKISYIFDITDKYKELNQDKNLQKHMKKFIFDMSEYLPPDKISGVISFIENKKSYPTLIKTFELLDKKDKAQISNVISNCKNYSSWEHFTRPSCQMLTIFMQKYPEYKDKFSAEHIARTISNCVNSKFEVTDLKLLTSKKLDYLINIDDYDKQEIYSIIFRKGQNHFTETEVLENTNYAGKLLDAGYTKMRLINDAITRHGLFHFGMTKEDKEQYVKDAQNLLQQNIDSNYINAYAGKLCEENKKLTIDIRNEAIKRKDILAGAGEELSCADIDEVFLENPYNTATTLKTIGKDAFLYSFAEKLDNVENYIETIGDYCNPAPDYYENLLRIINPTESQKYKDLSNKIKDFKNRIKNYGNNTNIMSSINSATRELNDLVKKAIKDPKTKLETAMIFAAITEAINNYDEETNEDNPEKPTDRKERYIPNIGDIINLMNPKTEEEKKAYNEKLNQMVFSTLEIEQPREETIKRLSFKDSKYLPKLFIADGDFKDNFAQLVELLDENPHTPTLQIFNNLPQNIETKRQFQKYGLNYDSWVKFNPDSKLDITIKTDHEKQKRSAIRNLEADLNDELFKKLPKSEKKKLFKALNKEGIQVLEKDEAIYEGDGFLNGTKKVLRLYKDNNPVEFGDLPKIIKLIKEEMNKNSFWNTKSNDTTIDNARETIKNHILKLRYNEVKTALKQKADKDINLVIQKADMNDITHALFLGNDASCCTKVGTGCNQWSAPTYIMNKLISCIEVKDGENYVGNTMMYVADIKGKPALILDNIELKSQYQYNDKIRDAIFEYAKIITKKLGKPNMPIYAGPNRHKVDIEHLPLKSERFKIIGSTGEQEIYLDFDAEAHSINPDDEENSFEEELYKIR